jgi:NADH-quinone oxidoreductase subunit E
MLSNETHAAIRREVSRYPQKKTALLPSLKIAQRELGWLSKETIAEVADAVGVPHAAAVELATFYSMLFTEPVAKSRVEVCIQLPCALRGAEQTFKALCDGLGIHAEKHGSHAGGTTADGKVEVHSTVECFGACHRAPMCRVGDDYKENLDAPNLQKLIDELNATRSGTANVSTNASVKKH